MPAAWRYARIGGYPSRMTRGTRSPARLLPLLRWPAGAGLVSWRYLWLTTPIHRKDLPGDAGDTGPPIPAEADDERVQHVADGTGPFYHRLYRVRIRDTAMPAERLIGHLADDPNRATLIEVAVFQKVRGEGTGARPGDEYVIRMPGPWDGPVRVVERTPVSFRLATLRGHLEAGQIEFRARRDGGHLVFEIESWARSGDRLAHVLYDLLWVGREMQLHLWLQVCLRMARLSGGHRVGGIEVFTSRAAGSGVGATRSLSHPDARAALDQLHDKGLNFDAGRRGQLTPANGWHVDDYRQVLPPEPPGPPLPDGSWETARRLMRDYEFADPSIITAIYHPGQPLDQRDMLLDGRFLGLRFRFGCSVGGINDETRTAERRRVRVWGWNYRTLQGHLEMGQMDYEVWKWLDDGTVEFRIHAVSKAAHIANPLIRAGFLLFGRRMQVTFARHACRRMEALTTAELVRKATHVPTAARPRAAGTITVAPAADHGLDARLAGRQGGP